MYISEVRMGAGHSHAQIKHMSAEQVHDVLIMNGWGFAAKAFVDQNIDGRALLKLDEGQLTTDLNMNAKDAERMLIVRETFLQHKPTITRAAVCKWSIEQVGAMLRLNHLGQYARAFQQKGINGGLLIQLKESIGQPGELITSALDIERLQSVVTFYVT